MKKQKPRVLLLYGGKGCESSVSERGAVYLRSLIDRDKFELIPVFIDRRGEWFVREPEDFSNNTSHPLATPAGAELLTEGVGAHKNEESVSPATVGGAGGIVTKDGFLKIDCAFPLLHGDFGEDGIIQGALAAANIPYVGADTYLGPLAMDKAYTKIIAESLGIRCARSVLGIRGSSEHSREKAKLLAEEKLGYPMFIKPARLGSSVGARCVVGAEDFFAAYDSADSLSDGRVLIEELVDIALEAECAVFRVKNKEIITDIGGISCTSGFYDYGKKYSGERGALVSDTVKVDSRVQSTIREYAKKLSDALGIRHLSRIDFFVTRDGEVLFNEINTMPGFTEGSLYPKLLKKAGIDPAEAVTEMLEDAMGI